MHASYELNFKHPPDFKVKYRFLSKGEGGRSILPGQGYRSDFLYEFQEHKKNQIFVIYPEFENEQGELMHSDLSALKEGIARMWILNPTLRPYHNGKIKIGLKCYFVEGPQKVAECEVIEIIGLPTNPTSWKK